jgi:hypothetical protein
MKRWLRSIVLSCLLASPFAALAQPVAPASAPASDLCSTSDDTCQKARLDALWLENWGRTAGADGWLELASSESAGGLDTQERSRVIAHAGDESLGEATFTELAGSRLPLFNRSGTLTDGSPFAVDIAWRTGTLAGPSGREIGVGLIAVSVNVEGQRATVLGNLEVARDPEEAAARTRLRQQAQQTRWLFESGDGGGGALPEVYTTDICRQNPDTWGHLDHCGTAYCSCERAVRNEILALSLLCTDAIYGVVRSCLDAITGRPRNPLDIIDCIRDSIHVILDCDELRDYLNQAPELLAACRQVGDTCYCRDFTQYHSVCATPVRARVTGLVQGERVNVEARCLGGANPAVEQREFTWSSDAPREMVRCDSQQSFQVTAGQVEAPGIPDYLRRNCAATTPTAGEMGEQGAAGPLVRFDCRCNHPEQCPRTRLYASVTGLGSTSGRTVLLTALLSVSSGGEPNLISLTGAAVSDTSHFYLDGPGFTGARIERYVEDFAVGCTANYLLPAGSTVPTTSDPAGIKLAEITCDQTEPCNTPNCQVELRVRVRGDGYPRPGGINATIEVGNAAVPISFSSGTRERVIGRAEVGTPFRHATLLNPTVQSGGLNMLSVCTITSVDSGTVGNQSPFYLMEIDCQRENPYGGPGRRNGRPHAPPALPGDPFRWLDCELYCPAGGSGGLRPCAPCECGQVDHDSNPNTPDQCIQCDACVDVISSNCYFHCGEPFGPYAPRSTVDLTVAAGSDRPREDGRIVADEKLTIRGGAAGTDGLQGFIAAINGVYVKHANAGGHSPVSLDLLEIDTSALPAGEHLLEVMALDNHPESPVPSIAAIPFTVEHTPTGCAADTAGPTLGFDVAPGASIGSGTMTVWATATDPSRVEWVQFYVDGDYQGSDGNYPYSFAWTAAAGTPRLKIRAQDGCGNAAEKEIQITVSDACAGLPLPGLTINLQDGAALAPAAYFVEAQATDHSGRGISRVEFKVGSFNLYSDSTAPYKTGNYYLLTEGPVPIVVKAIDGCGRITTRQITVNITDSSSVCGIDQGPPRVTVSSPTQGATVDPHRVVIDAQAIEDTVLYGWVLWIDDQPVHTSLVGTPTYHWEGPVGPGSHVIEVRAVDVCFKIGHSATIQIEANPQHAAVEVHRTAVVRVLNGPTYPPGPPVEVDDTVDFGATRPGVAGAARKISILNDGGTDLRITAVHLSGNAFRFRSAAPKLPLTIGGFNGESFLEIEPTGQGSGYQRETLTLEHDGPGGVITLTLIVNVDPVDGKPWFSDPAAHGFESGNLSGWTGTYGTAPTVTQAAALRGSYGMDASFDGVTAQSFVFMNLPARKSLIRAEFRFDPNSFALPEGIQQSIAAFVTADGTPVGWMQLKKKDGYWVRVVARLDGGSQAASEWVPLPDQPQVMTFDWWAASAAGANDGGVRVRQNWTNTSELRTLDNDQLGVDQFRLGALWGVVDATEGHLYFDDVTLRY